MNKFTLDQIVRTVLPADEASLPTTVDGKDLAVGTRAKITKIKGALVHGIWLDGVAQGEEFGPWHQSWFEVDNVPGMAHEVTIDFSLSRYATAREYAANATSRILPEEANDVLKAVAAGEKVNVLALNAALPKAFSAAATRYGQSPARRQATSELRHLSYIVQATLSNIIKGLPPVDAGARSPRIAELESEVKRLKADARARIEVATQIVAAKAEVDKQVEIAKVRAARIKVLEDQVAQTDEELEEAVIQRDSAVAALHEEQAVIDYLFSLGIQVQDKVAAFRAGYRVARSEG